MAKYIKSIDEMIKESQNLEKKKFIKNFLYASLFAFFTLIFVLTLEERKNYSVKDGLFRKIVDWLLIKILNLFGSKLSNNFFLILLSNALSTILFLLFFSFFTFLGFLLRKILNKIIWFFKQNT